MKMENDIETYRASLILVCEKVLRGELSLKEFCVLWPGEMAKTEFISELYDDLEDGVEHFPGHLLSGERDFETWTSSHMAQMIRIDLQLLISGLCEKDMLALRRAILDGDVKDDIRIKKMIDQRKAEISTSSEM